MTVTVGHADQVATIVLDRPDKLNALNQDMARELLNAIRSLSDIDVRTVVISGRGRGFSAGRDLSEAEPLTENGAEILRQQFNPLFRALRDLEVPTIAAVRGPALGVGLGLALACDITIAAHDAKIGSPFAGIGAVLDSGGHFHLVNRIGAHRALELIYTARLMSGEEAAAIGLINRSVRSEELTETVEQLAKQLAAGPTAAFALSKRLVRRIEEEMLGFADVLDSEAEAQGLASRTADYAEGIGAFNERRRATFVGK